MTKDNKKTILIVEDEMAYQRSLIEKLTHEGFNVLSAMNGEDGLRMAVENEPDLILMDVVMPKMDGMTMLREIRGYNLWGASVPVFILSNLSSSKTQVNSDVTELRPTYFLEKVGVSMGDLVAKIHDRLAHTPPRGGKTQSM